MFKKSLIVLGLSAIAITSMQASAMAGHKGHNGYEPLYWNGPAGYDYNDLFKKRYGYKRYAVKSCHSYKKKYLITGKKFWLRKYKVCKIDQY